MISTVPWPELLCSIQRIVHAGVEGLWIRQGQEAGSEGVPVRCYATSNFVFATIVVSQADLPKLLASPGLLQISTSEDERVLLNFFPTATTVLTHALSHMATPDPFERNRLCTSGGSSDPVLIFGRVLSVELLVPSHAIDVMALSRSGQALYPDPVGVGLN
jgi:hypothetical protein